MAAPVIAPFADADRAAWETLARGYKAFYRTPLADADYAEAWRRLRADDGIHGLGARVDGELVGIAHYLFHTAIWKPHTCYLQDLFTAPAARGHGVGQALIDAVAAAARAQGCDRYYWLTHADNATARNLYDQVAECRGFVRYDYPMPPP